MKALIPRAGRWLALAGVSGMVACAGVPQWEQPGAAREAVIARLGSPTAVHPLPGGERLQYSQQPAGRQVHNLDFDRAGRLLVVEQVMDPAVFARIETGRWTRDDLLRLAPGNAADPIDCSIDKRVERLRRKLEKHGLDVDLIETVQSDGYIYKGPIVRG